MRMWVCDTERNATTSRARGQEGGKGMFRCRECDSEFLEPKVHTEHHGLDTLPYEAFETCPMCGSTNYELMHICKECNEERYEFSSEDDDYCQDCADIAIDELRAFLNGLTVGQKGFLEENGFVNI